MVNSWCICTYEKGKLDSYNKSEKSSNKGKKGKKRPGTNFLARVPKKVRFKKHCNLCKKHGGAHTTHNTRDCRRFKKDGKEKSGFHTAKKGWYKSNLVNQNFAQLTNNIRKLERHWRGLVKKGKSAVTRIVMPTPNRELGWVALGN